MIATFEHRLIHCHFPSYCNNCDVLSFQVGEKAKSYVHPERGDIADSWFYGSTELLLHLCCRICDACFLRARFPWLRVTRSWFVLGGRKWRNFGRGESMGRRAMYRQVCFSSSNHDVFCAFFWANPVRWPVPTNTLFFWQTCRKLQENAAHDMIFISLRIPELGHNDIKCDAMTVLFSRTESSVRVHHSWPCVCRKVTSKQHMAPTGTIVPRPVCN